MNETLEIPELTLDEVIANWHASKPVVLVRLCCGKEDCDVAIWSSAFDIIRLTREHDMVGKADSPEQLQKFNEVLLPALLDSPIVKTNTKTMAAFESACFAAGMLLNHGYKEALLTSEPEDLRLLTKPRAN